MKHLSRAIIAVFMAVLMGTLLPVQVFADTPDYISEVKIGMGVNSDSALAALEGYTVLKNGNTPVDLNNNAGKEKGGTLNPGGKGNKVVYLGYKITKNRKEAITDLALMNMKGGYDVNEYEALMELQLKSQILPFVESFTKALEEYRANYNSKNRANRQRARYIHDILNKLTDDDTGGQLGDLLLNKTKYELGDKAYNALSNDEKKNHADIVTIIAQANGRATLTLENLITRAADMNDSTWLERFEETTYDDLIEQTGESLTDAKKTLARMYDDNANTILEMWEPFREELSGYDDAVNTVEKYDEAAVNAALDAINSINDNTSEAQKQKIINDYENAGKQLNAYANAKQIIAVYERLSQTEYSDSTLLDFFLQDSGDIEDDITQLYPMAAAFSKGQLTGLEFISLKDLVLIAISGEEGYSDNNLDKLESASIYEGVDRAIYEKGGVALTTEARRKKAAAYEEAEKSSSNLFNIMLYVSIGLGAVTAVSGIAALKLYMFAQKADVVYANKSYELFDKAVSAAWRNSKIATSLTAGLSIVTGILLLITIAIDYSQMSEYYNVQFTPIPRYMVDEKDLIGYNKKGEKVVLKNQTAYYKAVQCNRTEADEMYNSIGNCADLNGDVGKQWLALYAVKNELMEPILANSLKAVTDSEQPPSGYATGVHMFGSDAAFNLNNNYYVWNNSAPSIYVYFKADDSAASTSGANFTSGTLALAGGAGLILGAAVTAIASAAVKKKENTKATVA